MRIIKNVHCQEAKKGDISMSNNNSFFVNFAKGFVVSYVTAKALNAWANSGEGRSCQHGRDEESREYRSRNAYDNRADNHSAGY